VCENAVLQMPEIYIFEIQQLRLRTKKS